MACIFTKKFRTLDLHPPTVKDFFLKKTFFLGFPTTTCAGLGGSTIYGIGGGYGGGAYGGDGGYGGGHGEGGMGYSDGGGGYVGGY